ncbi:ribonuclease E/G [Rhodopila sp.]|uniref:ribonuclease E/G n=1 Tax=Rhodopila sp. TaxID=2480087 RepID=UPI003D1246A9
MSVTIHAAASPGEIRLAVMRDGTLLDFSLWRPGAPDGVGDLHRGRVVASVPAMAGAFVALADAEGFLPDSEGARGLTVGTILGVRVTRAAQGSKGPRLSARLTPDDAALVGGAPVGLLRRGPDPAMRLAARYPAASVLVNQPALAARLRPALGARVTMVDTAFDDDVAEAVEALFHPLVTLPGGASLSIWPTPALVAIDIDAGAALPAGGGRRGVHEALNRAILPALAAQIRLRDLSGGIVVDLAGLSARKRVQLAPDLAAALADDPLRPKFLGFTALGLAEIVRARVHPPLHELLSGPHAAGLAALRAVVASLNLNPRAMPALKAAPSVVSALHADPVALADLVRRTGRDLILRSDPSLPPCRWVLEQDHG